MRLLVCSVMLVAVTVFLVLIRYIMNEFTKLMNPRWRYNGTHKLNAWKHSVWLTKQVKNTDRYHIFIYF